VRRTVRILVLAVVALVVIVLFVLPGRTLLAQSRTLAATRHRMDVLSQEDASLARQAAALQTDARIEQLARQRYGLVKPGEQAFVVLPPGSPSILPPAAATPLTVPITVPAVSPPTTAATPAPAATSTTTTAGGIRGPTTTVAGRPRTSTTAPTTTVMPRP